MTTQQRNEKVCGIIATQLHASSCEVLCTSRITEDLGANWSEFEAIFQAVEETFQIRISDDDAQPIETVGELCDYLEKRVAKELEIEG